MNLRTHLGRLFMYGTFASFLVLFALIIMLEIAHG